jgi:RNA polymerase-binding transcription factor DksA
MPDLSSRAHTSVAAQLTARLAELEARGRRIEADIAAPLSADSGEAAVEREDDDALEGQDAEIARQIAAIRAAIARIDAGRYGQCTVCGQPVGDARLAAMPEAALCIACAREAETGR